MNDVGSPNGEWPEWLGTSASASSEAGARNRARVHVLPLGSMADNEPAPFAEAGGALEPGTSAALLVFENTWAAPFASAVRRPAASSSPVAVSPSKPSSPRSMRPRPEQQRRERCQDYFEASRGPPPSPGRRPPSAIASPSARANAGPSRKRLRSSHRPRKLRLRPPQDQTARLGLHGGARQHRPGSSEVSRPGLRARPPRRRRGRGCRSGIWRRCPATRTGRRRRLREGRQSRRVMRQLAR